MSTPDQQQIEPDSGPDTDSALGNASISTYTTSLSSSIAQRLYENGRSYHRFHDGQYLFPDDDPEQERLDMQHEMFLRWHDKKLFHSPLELKMPIKHVLDLGTGTGIWALDFADRHRESYVLGIDLSQMQPAFIAPNCKFEIADFTEPWSFTTKFDLIHGRMLATTCDDFPALFRQAWDNLQPGGYLEMHDMSFPLGCDDGTLDGTALGEWSDRFVQAATQRGRDPRWAAQYKEWMVKAGFEKVEQIRFKWPINGWARDRKLKDLGRWNQQNMLDGLDGFTTRLFSSQFGMTAEEIQLFLVNVRKDISNHLIHSYWPMYIVYGQKPLYHPSQPG